MKILFLLPPSEWKQSHNKHSHEKLSFNFEKPFDIAINACEKDLKCKGDRYLEWIELNKNTNNWDYIEAIHRYSGVMYKAINYDLMDIQAKNFFEQHFLIFSGMYWIVRPLDKIWNYKLPIETKWLYQYWWNIIPKTITELKPDFIVNLLPISYAKMIWEYTNCNRHKKKKEMILNSWTKIINVAFVKSDWKKISHWVKKIRWEWIKNICKNNITDYRQFGWEIIENWNVIDVNIKSW